MPPLPDPNEVPIGSLRWPVTIATRAQAAQIGGTGIAETLTGLTPVRASIEAVGPVTFFAASQTDRPVTHRVRLRWVDYLDITHVILRQTTRPDGSTRTETFRIRRIKELGGRKRFVEVECELESAK